MATNTPGVTTSSTGFAVLPQFQQNLYDLQTKQALAQALMQRGMTGGVENYRPQGGGYAYVPQYGIGAGLTQLASMLGGALLQKQASADLSELGQKQAAAYQQMFTPTTETTQPTVNVPTAQVTPGSFGLGADGGFTGGSPDAGRVALAQALAPQATTTTASPLNPMGMNPQTASMLSQYIGLPEWTKQFVAPSYKPTDATLAAQQAGLDPRAVNAAQIRKDTFIAPTAYKAGDIVTDPNDPTKTLRMFPNVGEGMEVVQRADGSHMVIEIPGYSRTVGGIEGARAQGRATGEESRIFNPATQQYEIVPRSQAIGGAAPAGGGLGTGRLGGAPGGRFAAGPALGTEQAAGVEGTEQAKRGIELDREAGAAPQQRLFIRELRQTMSGFDPGNPKADWALTMKKMVNTANPFGNTFDPHKIASQEQFNKAANQLAMAQFKDLNSGGANSTLETSMKSNPNATISRLGNKGILDLLQGNVDAKERMGQEWQRWKESNGPGSYSKFQTEWSKSYDPQVFMVPYQSKAEAAAMVNAMTPQERKVFQQKFNFAVKNGWIQLPE